ncbi:DNA mismatch repair endonuclease MutL [Parachlamydia sp. AcF125]|uniref:DNA mismatch repair endonuclease MutL n=1 Tax=Parachlamydia sp. AcF125 TaxID=2795736 RepID=UPI001BC9A7B0|nr:DNA mismatch repair endonuclease MutL [Parachlamydia sp. AcF125]MBS4168001.1 DNA mismatch repair protein MutL [Parachlamydia sp. AcF125]
MPSKIRILDEHTINKIAAGEVIENPASVVKEIIENAIDAGATEICVEIQEGGRQLIRISDNGYGMTEDDALLSLERHATSKLREVEDMETLSTMGFRGEAIPSIAAISKFMLLTSPASGETEEDKLKGTLILAEGGKILRCCPAARSPGTTVEVKSLFFNVPVRRKFQKSPTYDTHEILKILTLQSLAHPDIQFELISNQETLLKTPLPQPTSPFSEKLRERIQAVLGQEFSQDVCFVEGEKEGCKITGYIGYPSVSRPNRTGQFLFINQRAVTSPSISFAVREGYGTALATNRYPLFILHLSLPGALVDVNVHPQKKEVRLRQESLIKELIISSVQRALYPSNQESTPISFAAPLSFTPPFEEREQLDNPPPLSFGSLGGHFFDYSLLKESSYPTNYPQKACAEIEPTKNQEEAPLPESLPLSPQKNVPLVLTTIKGFILTHYTNAFPSSKPAEIGIGLIDQRAAHFRILFEQLQKVSPPFSIQTLLIPYTLETTPLEASLLKEYLPEFNAMGIQIKEFGPTTFIIDGIPSLFGNSDISLFVDKLMKGLTEMHQSASFKKEREKYLAQIASKSAIRKDHLLSIQEAQNLVRQLWKCDSPFYCPFGKPIAIHLSREEIARQFQP